MYTSKQLQEAYQNGTAREREAATWELIGNLDEWMPWLAARTFTGLSLTHKNEDWLLIVKAQSGKKAQVCFVAGDSPQEAYVIFVHALLFDLISWKEDRFTSMRSDNKGHTW